MSNNVPKSRAAPEHFSVGVIGGGVTGCAIAAALLQPRAAAEATNDLGSSISPGLERRAVRSLVLVEHGAVCSGASSGNSGVIHTGFDAPPGSVEAQCIARSRRLMGRWLRRFSIGARRCGAVMVAWTREDEAALDQVVATARMNKVQAERVDRARLLELEPSLACDGEGDRAVRGGVWIEGEMIGDPWMVPVTLAQQALHRGASLWLDTTVVRGKWDQRARRWLVHVRRRCGAAQSFTCDSLVNCAGLYGDVMERMLGMRNPPFHVTPRKGQFVVYAPGGADRSGAVPPPTRIILPVPTKRTKGVLVFPTVFETVVVGPTAEDQLSRSDTSTSADVTDRLHRTGCSIVPALARYRIVGSYAGLRPATEHRDYQIRCEADVAYMCVGGVRSTGLTACLGIGEYAVEALLSALEARTIESMLLSAEEVAGREEHARALDDGLQWIALDGYTVAARWPCVPFKHSHRLATMTSPLTSKL